jgi:hypothetical protein
MNKARERRRTGRFWALYSYPGRPPGRSPRSGRPRGRSPRSGRPRGRSPRWGRWPSRSPRSGRPPRRSPRSGAHAAHSRPDPTAPDSGVGVATRSGTPKPPRTRPRHEWAARASHTRRTESRRICNPPPRTGGCNAACATAGAEPHRDCPHLRAFLPKWLSEQVEWGGTWDLSCIVGESGVEWGKRMVMHRGTRVAGLLPPSHPGSDFARPHENP